MWSLYRISLANVSGGVDLVCCCKMLSWVTAQRKTDFELNISCSWSYNSVYSFTLYCRPTCYWRPDVRRLTLAFPALIAQRTPTAATPPAAGGRIVCCAHQRRGTNRPHTISASISRLPDASRPGDQIWWRSPQGPWVIGPILHKITFLGCILWRTALV